MKARRTCFCSPPRSCRAPGLCQGGDFVPFHLFDTANPRNYRTHRGPVFPLIVSGSTVPPVFPGLITDAPRSQFPQLIDDALCSSALILKPCYGASSRRTVVCHPVFALVLRARSNCYSTVFSWIRPF